MISRQALVSALTLLFSSVGGMDAAAQRPPRRCAPPDSSAEWLRNQHAWLSDARRDWTDQIFRDALLGAAGIDAGQPLEPQIGVQRQDVVASARDTAILARLRSLAATRGSAWPTRSLVGAAGVRAVWLLAQQDTALQRVVLHRMMESGPDEALAADVAVLEDRVRLQSGRKQLYGSQLRTVGGRLVPAPIEDSAHVDLRRDAAGLPPLRQAVCVIR